jgi:PncC family amidohydrolase
MREASVPHSRRKSVAIAESCTGGLVMSRVVATPGSGDWFVGGVVAYQSEVKFELLAIPEGPVVTPNAAMAMAAGVRSVVGSDIGISTTGVAGPEMEEDVPVGTVFVGVADQKTEGWLELRLHGNPDSVRDLATDRVIELIDEFRQWSASDADATAARFWPYLKSTKKAAIAG